LKPGLGVTQGHRKL